jgi:PTS system sorbose-specific iic component
VSPAAVDVALAGEDQFRSRRRTTQVVSLLLWILLPVALWLFIRREFSAPPVAAIACGPLCFRLLLLSSWAWLVALDERALGPFVFHEPLPAAAITGAICGMFTEGLMLGLLLQAIWPGLQPMGGSRQPVAGIAAVVGAAWLAFLPAPSLHWRLFAAWLVAMACARLAEKWEQHLRERNEQREQCWRFSPESASSNSLASLTEIGFLEAGVAGLIIMIAALALPLSLVTMIDQLSDGWLLGMFSHIDSNFQFVAPGETHRWLYLTTLFALGGYFGRTLPFKTRSSAPRDSSPGKVRPETRKEHRLTLSRLGKLLCLQACFSNRNLQRFGMANLIAAGPQGGDVDRTERSQRDNLIHTLLQEGTTNTNPVMSAALIGALDRVLIDSEQASPPRPPVRLLVVGGSLLAQWGDRVFWGSLRPMCNLLALALLPLSSSAVITVFLLAGFLLHLWARWRLYLWGLSAGWNVARGGSSWRWRSLPRLLEQIQPVLVMAVAIIVAISSHQSIGEGEAVSFAAMAVWFIVGIPVGRRYGACLYRWGWICGFAGVAASIAFRLFFAN